MKKLNSFKVIKSEPHTFTNIPKNNLNNILAIRAFTSNIIKKTIEFKLI